MEQIKTMNEYIAAEMGGKIVRKKEFPLIGVALLAVGAVMMVVMADMRDGGNIQTLLLTAGTICIAIGLLLTAMGLSGAQWHYCYAPTGSAMKSHSVYLSAADYNKAVDALTSGRATELGTLKALVSSNCMMQVLRSKDGAIALVQAGRNDMGHFEVETPVVCLAGTEVAAIEALCR